MMMRDNDRLVSVYLRTLNNVKAETSKQYLDVLNIFDRYIDKSFLEVEDIEILDFLDNLKSKRDTEAKAATKNKYITILKQFYSYLEENRKIHTNPSKCIKYYKVKTIDMGEDKIFTVNEIKKFLKGFKTKLSEVEDVKNKAILLRDKALYILILYYGFRIEEILGLEFYQIDNENRLIIIPAEKTKTGEEKVVGISDDVWNFLSEYLEYRETLSNRDNEYVFVSKNGNKISTSNANVALKKYASQVGIEEDKVHCHTLRHTAATMHLEDHSLVETSKLLGHRSIKTTMTYVHNNREMIHSNRSNKRMCKLLLGV